FSRRPVDLDPACAFRFRRRREYTFTARPRLAHNMSTNLPPLDHVAHGRDDGFVETARFRRDRVVREECWIKFRHFSPAILRTFFHSSAVTGCTERREFFASTMSGSSAFTVASVTGVFTGSTAWKSTHTNAPVLSVGSG